MKIEIGMMFDDLEVIEQCGLKRRNKVWKCVCVCGEERIMEGKELTRKNRARKCCKTCNKNKKRRFLKGQRFGKIVVLEDIPYD